MAESVHHGTRYFMMKGGCFAYDAGNPKQRQMYMYSYIMQRSCQEQNKNFSILFHVFGVNLSAVV